MRVKAVLFAFSLKLSEDGDVPFGHVGNGQSFELSKRIVEKGASTEGDSR
ncbi:hypothetical protein [Caballeronia sp. J97]|nr:hypothetical protein [Caballeronia sp. J97]